MEFLFNNIGFYDRSVNGMEWPNGVNYVIIGDIQRAHNNETGDGKAVLPFDKRYHWYSPGGSKNGGWRAYNNLSDAAKQIVDAFFQ
jgi:hypothetical protein